MAEIITIPYRPRD
jgi:phage terminase large subunit